VRPRTRSPPKRARVAIEGAGARLLALTGGRWVVGGRGVERGWNSTMHVLSLLRELGLDPASDQARRAVALVRDRVTWHGCGPPECDGNPFFRGRARALHQRPGGGERRLLRPGRPGHRRPVARRAAADGGWNCEAANGSDAVIVNTTICVLEALARIRTGRREQHRGDGGHLRGQEYLLERRMFRRRSTGEVIERDRKGGATWTRFAFPTWWHYDVLRGLDYLRRAGVWPDERVAEAIELVDSKRDSEDRWPLEDPAPRHDGSRGGRRRGPAERWNTLARLRVLDWYSARD